MTRIRRFSIGTSSLLLVAGLALVGASTRAGTPALAAPARRRPAPPLTVTSMSPRAGAHGVAGTAQVVVSFSSALAGSTPLPSLDPSTPGSWAVRRQKAVFTPSTPFVPLSDVTVTIPGGSAGMLGTSGARLARSKSESFHIADGSTARLQQLLSLLQYSPLRWVPAGAGIPAADTKAQLEAMYQPPKGTFSWEAASWPSELTTLWKPRAYNVFTRGLVMEFQADHGLVPNGRRSAGLWNDLLQAVAVGDDNQGGYDYALGDQHTPESLTIWDNGKVVLHAPANTGIAASPTPDGNFNVYARYRNEVMHGTNPDGVKYADPVQYVAYFHGGDAVHFLPRANYGIPQSLGCIELDLPDAAAAWPHLAYGTIVTVIG